MKIYMAKDKFGNVATIEHCRIFPYNGAKEKEEAYRLSVCAGYDDNFLYHVSVHETERAAKRKMNMMSCGEWKEIQKTT